jgi:hypothetical protein
VRVVVASGGVLAIVTPKAAAVAHPAYERKRKFKLGKRVVTFLSPRDAAD